jgi:hypothetical protein
MTASTKTTTAPHPELLTMLAARFPSESPAQLHNRAFKILELSDSLKEALSDFWATDH